MKESKMRSAAAPSSQHLPVSLRLSPTAVKVCETKSKDRRRQTDSGYESKWRASASCQKKSQKYGDCDCNRIDKIRRIFNRGAPELWMLAQNVWFRREPVRWAHHREPVRRKYTDMTCAFKNKPCIYLHFASQQDPAVQQVARNTTSQIRVDDYNPFDNQPGQNPVSSNCTCTTITQLIPLPL